VIKARQLSPASQEDLRRRVVAAVEAGQDQTVVAKTFGVGLRSVSRWVNTFRRNGNRGLTAQKRGRRPHEQKALDARQQARLRRAVLGKYPDQLALPGLVWTRGQVGELAQRWFGISLSRVTIGKYLRSWGLSPQKPIRVAYEKNPDKVTEWVEQRYPGHRRAGHAGEGDRAVAGSDRAAFGRGGVVDLGAGRTDPGRAENRQMSSTGFDGDCDHPLVIETGVTVW